MSNPTTMLPPGFRFHPTDEELILHYLKNRAASLPCPVTIIADVDVYKFDPWDLPAKAIFGEREWYFFTPRERKYPNGVRPNRAAVSGYWKATGTDKPIIAGKGNKNIGVKKALVFYKGRAPRGLKTGWIMHEYRITEAHNNHDTRPIKLNDSSMRLDDWVLCRIYKKSSSLPSMEDSAGEDGYLSNLANTTQQNSSGLKMQKSSSLAELLDSVDYSLLSRMFDNPSEQVEFKQGHQGYPSSSQPSINHLFQQPSQREPPVLIDENFPKRRRVVDGCLEEGGGLLEPLKKQNNSSIWSNSGFQFDGVQNNLLNQASINPQWLLDSRLGLGLDGPHM